MSNFNIHGSKIDQLNSTGNNIKQTSRDGHNAITEQGNVVQTEGDNNKVDTNKSKEGLLATIWGKLKSLWTGVGE